MNEEEALAQGEAAIRSMLRVANSQSDTSMLMSGGALPPLPDMDRILASASLDEAFSTGPVESLAKDVLRGFFLLGAQGFAFAPPETIRQRFGKTVAENYRRAGDEFLRLATSYWTLKQVHWNLLASNREHPIAQLTGWLEENVGAVFFPTPGPMSIASGIREQAQRNVLRKMGSPIHEDRFIQGNPLLRPTASGSGTSDGEFIEDQRQRAISKWRWHNPYLAALLALVHPLGMLYTSIPAFLAYLLVWWGVWIYWSNRPLGVGIAIGLAFAAYAYYTTLWKNAAIEKWKYGLSGTGKQNPKNLPAIA